MSITLLPPKTRVELAYFPIFITKVNQRQFVKPHPQPRVMAGSKTYADYLSLHELLSLQGDDNELSNDEQHFVIVHQNFELWFRLVLIELRAARTLLLQTTLPEEDVPRIVHHLKRCIEIFRHMANQWKIMETLTPQDFLAFRDGLGTASGFESYQMRELELLLGLETKQRVAGMDPLAHFRKLAERGETDAEVLERLEAEAAMPALGDILANWLLRTPIQGSLAGDAGDEEKVSVFVDEYLAIHKKIGDDAVARMSQHGVDNIEAVAARFAGAHEAAIDFLRPDGVVSRSRAGLLFIESYRELPLLAWPRILIDTLVELEESLVLFRTHHVRMVERLIGRRVGTGGSSGVDYLEATLQYRVFGDLWAVRTILIKREALPELQQPEFYGFA
uniref:Putative tryptophan-2,3-dioxygenase oxidoreductase protein (TDO2) n=1 Tax=uncultured marine group II/III euryarchaeote KM3_68_H12 TaxID=1456487 RepID=A0A075HG82_9EURY|nr:putative tryptophan-2,3-dioxygenase oxidoreductase protein (TDO2) [uncultured marine group II/III euryarchaeote KM3_68_H12]